MNVGDAWAFALSLPQATEEPHFEARSFRVQGKIFATLPPDHRFLHVFLDLDRIPAVVASHPEALHELHWGAKLCGVRIDLAAARSEDVEALLTEAWRRKAPKRLASPGAS
ncbi:MAG: MmcQ/YjbR family DNA-binding protein [Pseudomonadota bacterium]|nr:MmcQ/YjbR family DNA-binding protein [Pseudomonadota bacterium]